MSISPKPSYQGPPGTNRVLVVDDEEIIRVVLADILAAEFSHAEVGSAEEAMPFLRETPPDVMLVDKNLPGMSGLELLGTVKVHLPACEVIVISGYASLESAIEALRLGAFDYLMKPFDDIQLVLEKVRRAAEKKELEVERRRLMEQLLASNQELLRAQDRLRQDYMETLAGMITALEARDAYTRGHSDRVAEYSAAIGQELGLPRNELAELVDGARLHDLGKIGIREDVLNKPGRLTDEEYRHIMTHPAVGADILDKMASHRHLVPYLRFHHERIDGKGYPDSLEGSKIPLGARIIAVADTFDAMTSQRPYRKPRGAEEALRIIREVAGTQLDPLVVGAFLATRMRGAKRTPA